jgi:hypothetical protein
LSDESASTRIRMVAWTVEHYANKLADSFTVVTERTIRIRPG